MSDAACLVLTEDDDVAEVIINRDDIRNALAPEVRRELLGVLTTLKAAPRVRASSSPAPARHSAASGSIKQFKEQVSLTPAQVRGEMDETVDLFKLIVAIDKPIIAALNGYAFGAGCGLASGCDITTNSWRLPGLWPGPAARRLQPRFDAHAAAPGFLDGEH